MAEDPKQPHRESPIADLEQVLAALGNDELLAALDLVLLELEKRLLRYAQVGHELQDMAAGDGTRSNDLIDDTESTNWERTGAVPSVAGSKVTVNLQGEVQTVNRVQVSAMLIPPQNRFTALRQFEIWACSATVRNCSIPLGFVKIYTSPTNAFPGFNPRPVSPELILRSFAVPSTTATHVQIRVATNQCTGNAAFQGVQDNDTANGTDCREGSPGAGTAPIFGDLPQVVAPGQRGPYRRAAGLRPSRRSQRLGETTTQRAKGRRRRRPFVFRLRTLSRPLPASSPQSSRTS